MLQVCNTVDCVCWRAVCCCGYNFGIAYETIRWLRLITGTNDFCHIPINGFSAAVCEESVAETYTQVAPASPLAQLRLFTTALGACRGSRGPILEEWWNLSWWNRAAITCPSCTGCFRHPCLNWDRSFRAGVGNYRRMGRLMLPLLL